MLPFSSNLCRPIIHILHAKLKTEVIATSTTACADGILEKWFAPDSLRVVTVGFWSMNTTIPSLTVSTEESALTILRNNISIQQSPPSMIVELVSQWIYQPCGFKSWLAYGYVRSGDIEWPGSGTSACMHVQHRHRAYRCCNSRTRRADHSSSNRRHGTW